MAESGKGDGQLLFARLRGLALAPAPSVWLFQLSAVRFVRSLFVYSTVGACSLASYLAPFVYTFFKPLVSFLRSLLGASILAQHITLTMPGRTARKNYAEFEFGAMGTLLSCGC
jgi:hypothetical protein